jgi:hypothetical protein
MAEVKIDIGNRVIKWGGDYRFIGNVVAVFLKRDGESARVVVENDDGVIHIFNPGQLKVIA